LSLNSKVNNSKRIFAWYYTTYPYLYPSPAHTFIFWLLYRKRRNKYTIEHFFFPFYFVFAFEPDPKGLCGGLDGGGAPFLNKEHVSGKMEVYNRYNELQQRTTITYIF
jgi:hypothetical protein